MDDRKKVTEFRDDELLKICIVMIDSALDEVPMPDDVAAIARAALDECSDAAHHAAIPLVGPCDRQPTRAG